MVEFFMGALMGAVATLVIMKNVEFNRKPADTGSGVPQGGVGGGTEGEVPKDFKK